jgi:hypothetical protein
VLHLKSIARGRVALVSALLLSVVWVAELVLIFRPVPILGVIGAATLAAFVLLALTRGSIHIRVFFVLMVVAAASLAWWAGVPDALARGYARAQVFGAFFPAVLLLRATVECSPLLPRLHADLGRLSFAGVRNWTLYASHGLGVVLNVGALSILTPVVAADADEPRRRVLAEAAGRGIALDIMWSPFYVATPFTLQIVTQTALWQVMPLGLTLAAIGFAITYWLGTPRVDAPAFRASLARLSRLAVPMLFMVGAVIVVSVAFGLGALQSVAVVVPVLCIGYLLYLGPHAVRFAAGRTFASFGRLSEEILVVVGAMTLAGVVSSLPAVQALGASVTPGLISGPALMAALVVTIVVAGLAGLHPMISVGLLVPVLAAGAFGLCPAVLAATAVFGWGLNGCLSPWALPVAAAAAHFRVPLRGLINRRTLLFVATYALAGLAFLSAVNVLCT